METVFRQQQNPAEGKKAACPDGADGSASNIVDEALALYFARKEATAV